LELGYEEFTALFTRFDREAVHLEMRDSYGTAVGTAAHGQVGDR
jgi:hypothetical protein